MLDGDEALNIGLVNYSEKQNEAGNAAYGMYLQGYLKQTIWYI